MPHISTISPWTIRAVWLIAAGVTALGIVASTISIETGVQAPGRVVAESANKEIKHREGGVVAEVLVQPGATVTQGQVLVRLDAVEAQAALTRARQRLALLDAKEARLTAEAALGDMPENVIVGGIWRYAPEAYALEVAVLQEHAAQRQAAKAALEGQLAALEGRLRGARASLGAEGAAISRMGAAGGMQGAIDAARGRAAQAEGLVASIPGEIAATKAKLTQVDIDARSKARDELTAARAEAEAARAEEAAAQDRLARIDITAPTGGVIQSLAVSVKGDVVAPGGQVAQLIPVDDQPIIEARVPTNEIRGLQPGMLAKVRFSAFDAGRYGALEGKVLSISPDAEEDKRTGKSYFLARIQTSGSEIGGQRLSSGMDANVSILTGERSVMGYLLAPVRDAASTALTER